jgi:hypothetical protein
MRPTYLTGICAALLTALALAAGAAPAAACTADFNNDTLVNQADVNQFTTLWHLSPEADFNRDGTVDLTDWNNFQSAWFGNQSSADLDRDNQVYPDLDDFFGFLNDYWLRVQGKPTTDCDANGVFDELDFAIFFSAWCAAAGC